MVACLTIVYRVYQKKRNPKFKVKFQSENHTQLNRFHIDLKFKDSAF